MIRTRPRSCRSEGDRPIDFEQEVKEKDPGLLQRGAPGCAQQRVCEITALGGRQAIEVNFEECHALEGQGSATSTAAGIVLSVVALVAHGVALRLWFADRRADADAGR
jgi:hypothetical protein